MNIDTYRASKRTVSRWALLPIVLVSFASLAQVAVDQSGNTLSTSTVNNTAADGNGTLSAEQLQDLVGPIALYPDELLAIVLPASTYPLQVVELQRFLQAQKTDPSLKPKPEWDDSIVALSNYPDVVDLLNKDLDWTWRLGEAVVSQQADVLAAVTTFRESAYAAGNLKSDDHQNVVKDDNSIQITPVQDDVIYVPYYEPAQMVTYQPRPAYYYYPSPYPVYYYPYPDYYSFNNGFFWGVTTAFTIGWFSDSLYVYHPSYYGHPYYGRNYNNRWWYRRPTLKVYNNVYGRNNHGSSATRYRTGDSWQPHANYRLGNATQRITRTRTSTGGYTHYQGAQNGQLRQGFASPVAPKVNPKATTRSAPTPKLQPRQGTTFKAPRTNAGTHATPKLSFAPTTGTDVRKAPRVAGNPAATPKLRAAPSRDTILKGLRDGNRSSATPKLQRSAPPTNPYTNSSQGRSQPQYQPNQRTSPANLKSPINRPSYSAPPSLRSASPAPKVRSAPPKYESRAPAPRESRASSAPKSASFGNGISRNAKRESRR